MIKVPSLAAAKRRFAGYLRAIFIVDWDESEHPRAEKGRFGAKNSASEKHALQSIAKPCTIRASDGTLIRGYSSHAVEQLELRGIDERDVDDALSNAMCVLPDREDDNGQFNRQYIGERATVVINPESGIICTGWKTGSRLRRKYGGQNAE